MDELELKGNSLKQQAEEQQDEEKNKIVLQGNVRQKKGSTGKAFIDNFINEDKDTIKSHILFDIIIPAVKDTIFNGFQTALEMLLYGNDSGRRNRYYSGTRRVTSSGGPTNYNAISNQRANRVVGSGGHKICDQILFDDRADAMRVLDEITAQAEDYGAVSAYALFDAAGLSCDYTLKNWGWYDLNSAKVVRTREGDYTISLPKMDLIK